MRTKLFLLSIISLALFTLFSYNVAKERFVQRDFDTTVKVQDHIPRKYDEIFSYFSLLGSVEITFVICLILSLAWLIRGKWAGFLGWLLIIPASIGEVFGKLVLFHPSPPVFFHRTLLSQSLPSFYVHTNFSYPSGHMTRTIFIITVLGCLFFFSRLNLFFKYGAIFALTGFGFMMGLTRIYLGEHWLSDVVGGTLLGVGFGLFAYMLIILGRKKIPETVDIAN
ncbi:phosphatase PAP2 family protein [Candidatus Daviesbacteria bacterium]|nr:phosphatase PAP2 family protein [Candidatus Daviesbacteria bacterium]